MFHLQWHQKSGPGIWQALFYLLLLAYGAAILLTFSEYGITVDEHTHATYGENNVRWYLGLFQDPAILQYRKAWLHGGAFNTPVHLISQISPLDTYDTRHLCTATVALLGVVAAYRLGCVLSGGPAGLLAALFLVLTPRYYGHGFNNPKDIPFAVFYLWGVYCLVQSVRLLPNLPRGWIWKTGLAIGLALGVRMGGVVLLGYVGLFYGLRYFQVWREGEKWGDWDEGLDLGKRFLVQFALVFGIAYGTMLVLWPWAQVYPVSGPWRALQTMAFFPEVHYNLFEGRYVGSTDIPWYYAPKWLLLTLPEFVFIGLAAGMVCVVARGFRGLKSGDVGTFQRAVVVFGALFPLGYGIFTQAPLYHGLRHLLFVVPPLVVVSAAGVVDGLSWLGRGWKRWGLMGATGGFVVLVFWEMVQLHPNEVVYFNRVIGGGIERAGRFYDTDCLENSYRQGVRWVESHYGGRASGRKVRISSLNSDLQYMTDPELSVYVKEAEEADFYLGVTRWDRHRTVPGEVVHTVRARGVPLLYIVRPDSSYRTDPFFAESPYMQRRLGKHLERTGRLEEALIAYKKALLLTTDNVQKDMLDSGGVVYLRIGNVYLALKRYDEALESYRKAYAKDPDRAEVYNNLGVVYARIGSHRTGLRWILKAVEISPDYFMAYLNLGDIYLTLEQHPEALDAYRQAAKIRPEIGELHHTIGSLYYRLGRYGEAKISFLKLAELRPKDAAAHHNLGRTYMKLGRYAEAESAFARALEIDPEHPEALQNLADARQRLP